MKVIGGFRRLALLSGLVCAAVLVVGAQAASAQVIEICKSSSNGMSGRPFSYTVAPSGGSSFSVGPIQGGRCSGPITVSGSTATITEAQSDPATDVKSVTVRPSARKTSEDLAGRRVTVQTGASTASETLVTFTNQPAGGSYGTLKICKFSEASAYVGLSFSFSVNGGPLVSVEATTAFYSTTAEWSCRPVGSFPVGTLVNVHEAIPAGSFLYWVDAEPFTALEDFDVSTGDTYVRISGPATAVLYDNEPLPPSGTGWLEVCKNALEGWWDPDAAGTYNFIVTDGVGDTHSLSVIAGQCSEPIQVAAGVNEIVEAPKAGTTLTDVAAFPWDRLLTVNLINRSATVEVPVSDSANDETQVHFRNEAVRGQLKVCKALGPGSADLIGHDFYFDVHDTDAPVDGLPLVEITAAATTQCKIVGFFPIGHTVHVEELRGIVVGDGGQPLNSDFIDRSGEGDITIQPGVNTKTITNTARGLLEVCKAKVQFQNGPNGLPPRAAQPVFQFKIDNGAYFSVQAGKCSPPKRVSVGNHTVTEVQASDFELDSDRADGGIAVFPADRLVSKSLATRTVTVSVPYGTYGETLVTFYNRVKLGMVKVCKVIPMTSQDSLGMKDWTFEVDYSDGPHETIGPIKAGECTAFGRPHPILDFQGDPIDVTISENVPTGQALNVTYTVDSITCTGCRPPVVFPFQEVIHFNLGPGTNVVTYTNRSKDP